MDAFNHQMCACATIQKGLLFCLPTKRVAACLLQELREKHAGAVSVEFDVHCTRAEWQTTGGQEVSKGPGVSGGGVGMREEGSSPPVTQRASEPAS